MNKDNRHVKYINHKNNILAIIIRNSFSKEGIEFFTPNDYSQQVGYMKRPKGYHIKPHLHHHVPRRVSNTQEVLIVKRGKVRVDFYDAKKKYLMSENLLKGDIIILISCGHGFFMEKESELIEVKQGPYLGEKDKERFDSISNDMVIMEKD
tara:strand:- start:459 stop:911 length:453 start_codon:yes stop_codon:yes gene_type:complete